MPFDYWSLAQIIFSKTQVPSSIPAAIALFDNPVLTINRLYLVCLATKWVVQSLPAAVGAARLQFAEGLLNQIARCPKQTKCEPCEILLLIIRPVVPMGSARHPSWLSGTNSRVDETGTSPQMTGYEMLCAQQQGCQSRNWSGQQITVLGGNNCRYGIEFALFCRANRCSVHVWTHRQLLLLLRDQRACGSAGRLATRRWFWGCGYRLFTPGAFANHLPAGRLPVAKTPNICVPKHRDQYYAKAYIRGSTRWL